jgi:hypothetical protein
MEEKTDFDSISNPVALKTWEYGDGMGSMKPMARFLKSYAVFNTKLMDWLYSLYP